jgi:hypothetical protein
MRPAAVVLVLVSVVVSGCTSGDEAATTTPPAPPPAPTETSGGTGTTEPPESVVAPPPGPTLIRFVRAARAGNAEAMWRLLSAPTQERFGPTLAAFRNGAALRLATTVGSFVPRRSNVFLNEQVNEQFAVAAFGGRRIVDGRARRGAYAAALRFEDGAWRLELGGPVLVEALVPDPGEVENENAQVAAGVEADASIVEGGLWLDGNAVPGESGGTDDRHITFYSDPVGNLARGPHAAVAFASTSEDASALAWLFSVR